MKPDFLDELEKQLVEATEQRRLGRVRRWLPRMRRRRVAITGGGAAIVVVASAMFMIVSSISPGRNSVRGASGAPAGTRTGVARLAALYSRASGSYLPDGGAAAYATAASSASGAEPMGMASLDMQGAVGTAGQVPGPKTAVTTRSVAAGFQPESFTAISSTSWWLLGSVPCARRSCLTIVRTTDAGRRFIAIPAPPTTAVGELRFGGTQVGYAYGRELWSTHDGGQRWTRVRLGGAIAELATNGSYVYAIVRKPDGGSDLMRSPVGLDAWESLEVAGGHALDGLWVQGSEVFVESSANGGSAAPTLAISTDNGFDFSRQVSEPLAASCQTDAALPVIWSSCAAGKVLSIWRSTDGGPQFRLTLGRAAFTSRLKPGTPSALESAAAFAAADGQTAVVGAQQLYRTVNGGRSYAPVPTPRGIDRWQYLGFTTPTHGVAIGLFGPHGGRERLYYTTDAGARYRYVSVGG